jgi:hypothetical protein
MPGVGASAGVVIGVELGTGSGVVPGLGLGLIRGDDGVSGESGLVEWDVPPGLVVFAPGSPELAAPPVLAPPPPPISWDPPPPAEACAIR